MVASLIAGLVLASFLVVQALGIPLLVDPTDRFAAGGLPVAALGVGLLLVDVVIPVPSSIVMTAQGALFGFGGGLLLGLVGSVGATLIGFGIGRRSSRLVARLAGVDGRHGSGALLHRFGPLALIVTRPMPILAETTAILAGTTAMTWRQAATGALVGCLPAAALYSAAGAFASDIATGVLVFPVVVALAALVWIAGWVLERRVVTAKQRMQAPGESM
jgi:uncharacterized membrane protein YdjX (TVP38/TMEM64 family)